MKKRLSLLVFAMFSLMASAQVSKTINVTTAGTLSTLLSATELSTVTNLTVTGNIDARDVKTMRDNMPVLAVLDMGAVSIKEFTGVATYSSSTTYPANEMPQYSFWYNYNSAGKTSLKTITLPTSIISIGDLAFYLCTGLTGSLILPGSVTTIGSAAFQYCSGFTGSLILPNSVTTIGSSAFYGCSGFTGSLTLPNSVTTIGDDAFSGCGFTGSLILPNSVTTIGSGAFSNCSGFTGSLTLPGSVTTIGDRAFYSCSGFKIINSLNATPPAIGTNTFSYVNPSVVYVPTTAGAAYKAATGWSGFTIVGEKQVSINVPTAGGMAAAIVGGGFGPLNSITHLTVTGNINSVDIEQMRTNMTALTAIDLSGVTLASNTLPANAFQSRTSLTSVILPATLLSIGDYAFDGCESLIGDIPIPASVNSIGAYAFQNCKSINGGLTIPTGVTVINNYTFYGCTGFTGGLNIPTAVTSIDAGAFNGCSGLTGNLTIPNKVSSVGTSAFRKCSGFTGTLSIGSGVTTIGDLTFSGCRGLTGNITIPNTVTSLGTYAFQYCSGFTGTLTLSNTLTTISGSAFSGCSQLSGKVDVPLSVTSIGASAFQNCAKITELSVGKNLTSIGDNALNRCISLIKISVPRTTPPTVSANTFTGIPVEACTINVPTGASLTYQIANYWSSFFLYTETSASDNYTLTVSIGANGSVKENNETLGNGSVITAAVGSTKTFIFMPNAGYAVATVSYGGVDVTSLLVNNQYTTAAINANATLNVTFSKVVYRLSIKDASTGTVNLVCDYGATFKFDFTPAADWKVSTVFYNNVDVTNALVDGVFTVPAITANSLLNVAFEHTNSGAPELVNSNVKVYSTQSDIIIEGTAEGESVTLLTINGKQIQSLKSQGERMVLPAQQDAVYLVKTAGKTFKVIL